ncbi:MAG: hypothetical protein KFB93_06155 [Simkaniaceae bacterium]|nr:MAG: hypothetical protein KFB93_06155 [Simkaniaceae bacterium]
MVETNIFRKNKINLEDYDYQKDIQNRVLMSQFSPEDLEVLEEIIYSSQKIPISRLVDQLDKNLDKVQQILEKLSKTDLFKIQEDTVIVDKEMRKYFETQIQKFDEDFTPGMEFLQALLKKVPIHVLPNWYPIPRTSNNIFNSLIEKYLETPQTFQRYLTELNLGDPILNGIVTDLFEAPEHKMYSSDIREKYKLSEEFFEEHLLYLEFNLICCLVYEKKDGEWIEVVTLFKEWKDYLSFLKESQPKEISKKGDVKRTRPHDFSFAEDMSTLLALSMTKPLYMRLNQNEEWGFEKASANAVAKQCKGFDLKSEEGQAHFHSYMSKVIQKLTFLKLARVEGNQLIAAEEAEEWLALPIEKRALNTYKVTLTNYPFSEFPVEICSERNIHEIEKSICRIIGSGWVLFDEFLNGVIAPISENSKMSLKKTGRYWKYSLPDYSEAEMTLIRLIIFNWLFEGGIIATGSYQGKECLRITPLGQSMFG